jgi:hypothetical protein
MSFILDIILQYDYYESMGALYRTMYSVYIQRVNKLTLFVINSLSTD